MFKGKSFLLDDAFSLKEKQKYKEFLQKEGGLLPFVSSKQIHFAILKEKPLNAQFVSSKISRLLGNGFTSFLIKDFLDACLESSTKVSEQDFLVEFEQSSSSLTVPSIHFSTDSIQETFNLFNSDDSLDILNSNFQASENISEIKPVKLENLQDQKTRNEIVSFPIIIPEKLEELSFEERRLLFIQAKKNPLKRNQIKGEVFSFGFGDDGQLGQKQTSGKAIKLICPLALSELDVRRVVQVSCGFLHTLLLMDDGTVFSMGKGSRGQLGHGDLLKRRKPELIESLKGIDVCFIRSGKANSAVISRYGELFTFGSNKRGQLGLGISFSEMSCALKPTLVHSLRYLVQQIAFGSYHAIALCKNNQIYSWGSNDFGELGIKEIKDCITYPRVIRTFQDNYSMSFVSIECGESFSAALTLCGLFTWGNNSYGQLGLGDFRNRSVPHEVEFFKNNPISKISCGSSHMAAISREYNLYTWGRAGYKSLGYLVEGTFDQPIPRCVESLRNKISDVSCGFGHTIAISHEDGFVWSFGLNDHKQLGFSSKIDQVEVPQLNMDLGTPTFANCGGFHSAICISKLEELILQHSIHHNMESIESILKSPEFNINFQYPKTGYSILHHAAFHNHYQFANLVLNHGIDPNLKDLEGFTALHVCVLKGSLKCLTHIFKAIDLNLVDNLGRTACHLAVEYNQIPILKVLIEAGADKRIVDKNKKTILHYAVEKKLMSVAKYLVRKAAPINVTDSFGKTPLDYCSLEEGFHLKMLAQQNDIFISYSHANLEFTRKLKQEIERNCIKCWMDEWRLEAGDDWRGDIGEGIMAAKVILFIISPKSVESDWCLKELRLGIQHGKIIIPILYQDCELDPTLKSLLHSKKFIDFTDPNQFEIKLNHLLQNARNIFRMVESPNYLIYNNSQRKPLTFDNLLDKRFICMSYGESNSQTADFIQSQLADHGIPCWKNSFNLENLNSIKQHISKCWTFLFIISSAVLAEEKLVKEVLFWAQQKEKYIFILTVENDEEEEELAIPISKTYKTGAPLFHFNSERDEEECSKLMYTLLMTEKETMLLESIDSLKEKLNNAEKELNRLR